jgi:hypothetical protein
MSFANDVATFTRKLELRDRALLVGVAEEVHRSVTVGSSITGAPGQPVGVDGSPEDGKLRDSITLTYPDEHTAEITTDVEYARDVEDNVRGVHFTNHGPHSFKLTETGFDRIVEHVAQRVAR